MSHTSWRLVSGVALILLASAQSHAVTLGRVQGAAVIGRPLDVTVPVGLGAGTAPADICPQARVLYGDAPVEARTLDIRPGPGADTATFRIRVAVPVNEAFVTVYLDVGCGSRLTRQYVLLADHPADLAQPAPVAVAGLSPGDGRGVVASPTQLARVDSQAIAPLNAPANGLLGGALDAPSATALALTAPSAAALAMTSPAADAAPAPAPAPAPAEPPTAPAPAAAPIARAAAPAPREQRAARAPVAANRPPAPAPAARVERPRLRLEAPQIALDTQAPAAAAPAAVAPAAPVPAQPAAPPATAAQPAAAGDPAAPASPDDRLSALEAEIRAMRTAMVASNLAVADMRTRLAQAERERFANPLVYALLALLAASSILAGLFWQRSRRAQPWWQGQAPASVLTPGGSEGLSAAPVPVAAVADVPLSGPASAPPSTSRPVEPAASAVLAASAAAGPRGAIPSKSAVREPVEPAFSPAAWSDPVAPTPDRAAFARQVEVAEIDLPAPEKLAPLQDTVIDDLGGSQQSVAQPQAEMPPGSARPAPVLAGASAAAASAAALQGVPALVPGWADEEGSLDINLDDLLQLPPDVAAAGPEDDALLASSTQAGKLLDIDLDFDLDKDFKLPGQA